MSRLLVGGWWLVASCAASVVEIEADGTLAVPSVDVSLKLVEHLEGWKGAVSQHYDKFVFPRNGRLEWSMRREDRLFSTGSTELRQDGRDAAFRFEIEPQFDRDSECLALSVGLPETRFAGGSWSFDDGRQTGTLPEKMDKQVLAWARVKILTLSPGRGDPLRIELSEPTAVLIQDDRRWSPHFTVRIDCDRRGVVKGEKRVFAGRIVLADGVQVSGAEPILINEGDDWVRVDYHKDIIPGSALDLSEQGLQDAPAGKYGWLRAVDGHFEFEGRPGVRQRFYGVNLCFSANYPDHPTAEAFITRLRRSGYNALRVHHHDGGLIEGLPVQDIALNPENADRLDYLLAKAIENGLYITTDLYVSRPVTWKQIGLEDCGEGEIGNKNLYKALVALWDPAFRDWCVFAERFLTHVNPYTGRSYLAEPALSLLSLINEGQLTMGWTADAEAIRENRVVRAGWKKWLAERRRADPSFCPDAPDDCAKLDAYGPHNAALALFMADTERRSATRLKKFLRGLGVRALITNANCGPHFPPMQEVREDCYDYVDDHFYIDHPRFLARSWKQPSKCGNSNPVQNLRLGTTDVAFTRMADKPFTITEWNFSGPGMYRGVGGILVGAYSALQDWDGLWRFAYAHQREFLTDGHGFPGYFDLGTDPLGMASDRASVCLYLRGDLQSLREAESYLVTPDLFHPEGGRTHTVTPDWMAQSWSRQVSTAVSRSKLREGTVSRPLAASLTSKTAPFEAKPNPEFELDRGRGSFRLVTSRTVGGFAPSGALVCGPLSFTVREAPATVWASSVDRDPNDIRHSRRLLVTHLTDVQASGNAYADAAKTILLRWGDNPPLMRNGSAEISLALESPESYEVWSLETSGRRLERIPCEVKGGELRFTAAVKGPHGARMLYEVVK